jgi:hypothetical protein
MGVGWWLFFFGFVCLAFGVGWPLLFFVGVRYVRGCFGWLFWFSLFWPRLARLFALVPGLVSSVLAGGRGVAVGCAAGLDACVRSVAGAGRFSLFAAAAFAPAGCAPGSPAALVARSAALVRAVAASGPGAGFVVFPAGALPGWAGAFRFLRRLLFRLRLRHLGQRRLCRWAGPAGCRLWPARRFAPCLVGLVGARRPIWRLVVWLPPRVRPALSVLVGLSLLPIPRP